MKRVYPLLALMVLTSACASPAGKAPTCSGPRRPANPYGSVLAPDGGKPSTETTESGAPPCGSAAR